MDTTTQPISAERRSYIDIVEDRPEIVEIPGTRKTVRIRGMKPYTIERLTLLWQERDANLPEDTGATLKSLCIEPYFAVKQAVLITLNNYWSIRMLYPIKWRIWAYLKGYTEEQMTPIIAAGKKKLPLMAHWTNMAYLTDMRTDWMRMTGKEAEQYRAELISVGQRHS